MNDLDRLNEWLKGAERYLEMWLEHERVSSRENRPEPDRVQDAEHAGRTDGHRGEIQKWS